MHILFIGILHLFLAATVLHTAKPLPTENQSATIEETTPESEEKDAEAEESSDSDTEIDALLDEDKPDEESGADVDIDDLLKDDAAEGEAKSEIDDLDLEADSESDSDSSATDSDTSSENATFSPVDGAEVTLPVLGNMILAPSPESATNATDSAIGATRRANAQAKQTYTVGTVSLTDVTGYITNDGHIELSGTCKLNDTPGTISVKSYNTESQELILTLSYKEPFIVNVFPDKETPVSDFLLTITPTSQELTSKQSIFTKNGQESNLSFPITGTAGSNATVAIENPVPLVDMLPDAKGNAEVEKIMLEDISLSFPNPLAPRIVTSAKEIIAPSTTITATAILNHIKLYGDAYLSNSDATIIVSPTGFSFDCIGQTPITLDNDLVLASPALEFEKMRGTPMAEFGIAGTLQCTLPVLGTLNTPMRGYKRDDGLDLSGKLGNTIDFGPVKFSDPEIIIATTTSEGGDSAASASKDRSFKFELRGRFDLFGIKVVPILRFVKPGISGITLGKGNVIQRVVEFSGELNGGKPLKPLEHIPGLNAIPGVADFLLEKAELGIDSTKKTFIGGTTTIMNIATKVKILTSGAKGMIASSLKPWKVSDSIPSLAGTVFDSIAFNSINFGFTATKYFDTASGMMMEKGSNIFGEVDLTQGVFAPLQKMLGKAMPKKLIASLILHPNPRHIRFQLAIPLEIKLSSRASMHQLIFEISGEPSVALMVSLKFFPSKKEPPLIFTARIEFELLCFAVSGTLQGKWKNPFGIPGLAVSDVAIEVSQPYAPLPPIGFGITGAIAIGDFLARAAVKIGPTEIILLAEVSEWPLFCLPALLKAVGLDLGPLDVLKAIDISLHDVKFKFAPAGGQIGTIYFDPGISASGKLILNIPSIIKAKLEAGFNLDWMSGFKLYAMMPKFNIGPLRITGKGKDRKWGTADDGPIFSITLSLLQQRIFISALAELCGSSAEIEIDIGLLHLRFKMIMKLLGLLDAHIAAETYRRGFRIGLKAIGTAKIGKSAEATIFGDINTMGFSFAGVYKSLSLKDLAELCNIPTAYIPNVGLEQVEFYIRAQG